MKMSFFLWILTQPKSFALPVRWILKSVNRPLASEHRSQPSSFRLQLQHALPPTPSLRYTLNSSSGSAPMFNGSHCSSEVPLDQVLSLLMTLPASLGPEHLSPSGTARACNPAAPRLSFWAAARLPPHTALPVTVLLKHIHPP